MRLLREVSRGALVICFDAFGAFFPVHRADFAVFFEVLERVDHADGFLDGTAERQVVDELVLDDAFLVDEEETAVGDELAFDHEVAVFVETVFAYEHVVVGRDGFVGLCDEGISHTLDDALIKGHLEPTPVRHLGVSGDADHSHIAVFELGEVVLESVKLSWADKSEILRVEEKNDVFGAFELVEREIFDDLAVDYGAGVKRRGRFSYK